MISANLLPMPRQRLLARQDRARRWAVAIAIYAGFLACLWIGSRSYVAQEQSGLERRVRASEAEKAGVESALSVLRQKTAKVQASLTTARSIAGHPDWSVLLSLVANLRGAEIEIERIALGPRKSDGKPVPGKSSKGIWVRVSGLGKDHQAVAQFALRLEGSGLFDRVGLSDASKSASEPGGFVGFEIEAQIDEPAGASK